jgi:hypothetical protein
LARARQPGLSTGAKEMIGRRGVGVTRSARRGGLGILQPQVPRLDEKKNELMVAWREGLGAATRRKMQPKMQRSGASC